MITKNFKALLQCVLQTSGESSGNMAIAQGISRSGNTIYIAAQYRSPLFPYYINTGVVFIDNASGIHVGSGDTAPTENDNNLNSQITSGLTASTPTVTRNVDNNNNPYTEFLFTLTNTTDTDIVVREIGFFQTVLSSATFKSTSASQTVVMLDRTVLSNPVTVPANDFAVIKYRLTTVINV